MPEDYTTLSTKEYSPFDALGLDPREDYSKNEVKKAFIQAVQHAHPDKRQIYGTPYERWPTVDHIGAARKVVAEHCYAAYKDFHDYPRTFFPHYGLGNAQVYATKIEDPNFTLCPICQMPLLVVSLETHLPSHQKVFCKKCEAVGPTSHFADEHGNEYCQECSSWFEGERDLARHNQDIHDWTPCPLCEEIFKWCMHLPSHLSHCHGWRPCLGCYSSSNPLYEHIMEDEGSHDWATCPYCVEVFEATSLTSHIMGTHHLRQCRDCPDQSEDFGDQASHLISKHPPERCQLCSINVPKADMSHHLIRAHSYKQCPYCTKTEAQDTYLTHIEQVHNPQPCDICQEELPVASLSAHLKTQHSWLQCSFCDIVRATQGEMRQHLQGHGSECPVCFQIQNINNLGFHLMEHHHWQKCLRCSDLMDSNLLREHTSSHEPTSSSSGVLCKLCGEHFQKSAFSSHYHNIHKSQKFKLERAKCHVCGAKVARGKLRRHIRSVHPNTTRAMGTEAVHGARDDKGKRMEDEEQETGDEGPNAMIEEL